MTIVRKSVFVALLPVFVLAAGAMWAIGTQSGTRWLIDRAATYLPPELRLGEVGGTVLNGISLDAIEWNDAVTKLHARSVFVHFRVLPLFRKHLHIDELNVASLELALEKSAESSDTDAVTAVELPLDLSIESATLRQADIQRDSFKRRIDALVIAANLRRSQLEIDRLGLESDWLNLELTGQVALVEHYPGRIEANWQWLASESGPFSGRLRMDGDMRDYSIEHTLSQPLAIDSSGTVAFVSDSFAADLLHEWQNLEWPLGEQTLYSSRGRLRTVGNLADVSLDLEADARLGELDGQVALAGSVVGEIRDSGPDVDLRIEQLDGAINGYPVRGAGDLGIDGALYSLTNARLQIGSNTLRVAGTFGTRLSVNADVNAGNLNEVFPDAAGTLEAQLSLDGTLESPDAQLELAGNALAWRDYTVGSLQASANLSALEQGDAQVQLSEFTWGDFKVDTARLEAAGRLDGHALRSTINTFGSQFVIEATGAYAEQSWQGRLDSLTVSDDALDRWATTESSQVHVAADRASLSQTCLFGPRASGQVCIGGSGLGTEPASFDLSVIAVPLAALPLTLPEGVTLRGFLHADASGQWQANQLVAKSGIELREAAVDAVYDDERISLTATEASAALTVTDNQVESTLTVQLADDAATASLRLSIDDFTNTASAVTGGAELAISDALFLAAIVPGIRNPQGRIDGTMTVAGSLDAPDFRGQINLTNGSFGVRQAGIEVSEVDVRVTQLAPGELRLLGSARSGAGLLAIDGRTQIDADTGIRSEIQLIGEDFELARLPDWQIAASPSITVVLDDRTASVSGELLIPTARITLMAVPESAQAVSPDAVVHREASAPPTPVRRIDVDVRTALGEDVRFSGFGLTTGLEGAVQIRGGTQTVYTGQGRLDLRDGRYKAYGQELEIERGQLVFNGPLENPQLSVRAVRRIDDIVAGIEISGTPTQLRSDVYSEPSMSDAAVLSYLLTGRPLASATSAGEGETLNNAAFALGLSGAGSITSQVRTQLGLETLAIEGGVDDSRLIAGKRFGDRLLVEYGYGLIDKLGTLLLRYQLNNRVVLESRTGTVSNLDVVYSVKKK